MIKHFSMTCKWKNTVIKLVKEEEDEEEEIMQG